MSALDGIPENINLLSPLGYRFLVKKLPNVVFFTQQVTLPSIVLPAVMKGTPFVKIPHPGDHIDFAPLTVNFKVDEDLRNYIEVFAWMRGQGFPADFDEYATLASVPKTTGLGLMSDISLMILNSAKNPIATATFKDAFPVSLSSLQFDTTAQGIQFHTATVVFNYTLFDLESLL